MESVIYKKLLESGHNSDYCWNKGKKKFIVEW